MHNCRVMKSSIGCCINIRDTCPSETKVVLDVIDLRSKKAEVG